MRWCSASTAFSRPADPAAPLMWPIWALTEPIRTERAGSPAGPYASRSAAISEASPTRVDVAWHSTNCTLAGP